MDTAMPGIDVAKSVTAFVGTASNKHTCAAVRALFEKLEAAGVRCEMVRLSDYDLKPCRGCKVCFMKGEEFCPLKDDRDELIQKMADSDGIVFASPNYSFQVSGFMKVFLDRLGFMGHRPRFHQKVFTSIVVQGFLGGGKIVKYFGLVGRMLGCDVVKGTCATALDPMTEKEQRKRDKKLERQSRRFLALLFQPADRAPSLFMLAGFRMGRQSVMKTLGEADKDYVYYRDRGWFDSDYFCPTRLGLFKRAAGSALDWLFGRMYARRAGTPTVSA